MGRPGFKGLKDASPLLGEPCTRFIVIWDRRGSGSLTVVDGVLAVAQRREQRRESGDGVRHYSGAPAARRPPHHVPACVERCQLLRLLVCNQTTRCLAATPLTKDELRCNLASAVSPAPILPPHPLF